MPVSMIILLSQSISTLMPVKFTTEAYNRLAKPWVSSIVNPTQRCGNPLADSAILLCIIPLLS